VRFEAGESMRDVNAELAAAEAPAAAGEATGS
jgi:hypothetical protein